ncbi:FAD:protein FMN transferase [Streptomyces anulatus]
MAVQECTADNSPTLCGPRAGNTTAAVSDAGKSLFAFDASGTRWEIETPAPLPAEVRERILDRVDRFDAVYSRFRPDSLVSQIAAAPGGGRFVFPDDAIDLFDLYDQLAHLTGGAMDPLVGRDLNSSATTPPTPSPPYPTPTARPTPTRAPRGTGTSSGTGRCCAPAGRW